VIDKMTTAGGVMFSAALILLVALNFEAVAAPPLSSTTVNNTPANPVPTVDAQDPAKSPFQGSASVFGTDASGIVLTTLPAGKRLVIETVSVAGQVAAPSLGLITALVLTLNGSSTNHFVGVNPTAQNISTTFYNGTHAVRYYADPSTDVKVFCGSNPSSGFVHCNVTISGYFVNVP